LARKKLLSKISKNQIREKNDTIITKVQNRMRKRDLEKDLLEKKGHHEQVPRRPYPSSKKSREKLQLKRKLTVRESIEKGKERRIRK